MHVRGLCSLSLFDRDYTYVINKDGRPMYLGYRSSVIFYDQDGGSWVWYDRKDNRSVAISSSPEASLFVGVHTVDFAGVKDDKCHSGPIEASRVKQVKMTSVTITPFIILNIFGCIFAGLLLGLATVRILMLDRLQENILSMKQQDLVILPTLNCTKDVLESVTADQRTPNIFGAVRETPSQAQIKNNIEECERMKLENIRFLPPPLPSLPLTIVSV